MAAAVVAGLAADAVVAVGRPQLATTAMSLALWPMWLLALRATGDMFWDASLVGGAVVLPTMLAALVQVLRPARGSDAWQTTPAPSPRTTGASA